MSDEKLSVVNFNNLHYTEKIANLNLGRKNKYLTYNLVHFSPSSEMNCCGLS